jgi:hypothetical protein
MKVPEAQYYGLVPLVGDLNPRRNNNGNKKGDAADGSSANVIRGSQSWVRERPTYDKDYNEYQHREGSILSHIKYFLIRLFAFPVPGALPDGFPVSQAWCC